MTTIRTRDGVQLYTKVWGEGRPVILIHGWPLSADTWDPQALALAESGYRVIAYDRRGFGRSEQPWHGYDYDSLSDDLACVMKELRVDDGAMLVGFSMGGGEVARYMSRHEGRGVVKAGLVSSVVPYMLRTDDNPHGVPEETFVQMVTAMKEDRPKFMASFLDDFFGISLLNRPVSSAFVDDAWRQCCNAGLRPTLACADAFAHTDFRPDLAAFRVPTLVVHGTEDRTVPIDATGRAAARAIAGSRLVEYEGHPHGVFATAQNRLTKDLLQFLAR